MTPPENDVTTSDSPMVARPRSKGAALVRSDAIALPLADESVDLIVTSPPYFALRSYTDDGEHYEGQIGNEPTPWDFLDALWTVTAECMRVLKPTGSMFVNLGDKFSGAQAQNGGPSSKSTLAGNGHTGGGPKAQNVQRFRTDSARVWSQTNPKQTGIPNKSLMGLPWRYALGCVDHLGICLRSEIIWNKPNGLPESVLDRVQRKHEQWFHLTKQDRYFSNIDDVREPYTPGTESRYIAGFGVTKRAANGATHNAMDRSMAAGDGGPTEQNPLGKLPSSVWTIPTEPLSVPAYVNADDHFAAFPQEWPRRLILGWSPPGGVVLDPFGGTGTTAMVARVLGRFGISNDLSASYLRLARWRIWESGHGAKSHDRTMADAQLSMLGVPA